MNAPLNTRPGFKRFQMGNRIHEPMPAPNPPARPAKLSAKVGPQWSIRRFKTAHLYTALQPSNPRGLGDRIHALLHPIAFALDWYFGTRFQSCRACSRRVARLNAFGKRISALFQHWIKRPFKAISTLQK